MTRSKLYGSMLLGSLVLLACNKQGSGPEAENAYTASNDPMLNEPPPAADPVAQPAPGTTASPTLEPGPVAITDPSTATPIAASAPGAAVPLTDGQIAKVAETVDKGEIDQAKEVQKRAKNPQVKKLAAHLIQNHTKSKQKGQSLVKKEELTPESSALCDELSAKVEKNLQTIKEAAAPADAERAYIDAQVAQHEEVLQLLNSKLIPSAVNTDLKAQLEETRKMVEEHIEQARKVKEELAVAAASQPAG